MLKRWASVFYLTTCALFLQLSAESRRGFFTEASALYWQAAEGGLGFAMETSDPLSVNGAVKNPRFDWDVGFKAGFGYRFPHEDWDLLLHFTSLQTHTDAHIKAHGEKGLLPTWLFFSTAQPPFAREATMHWRLHLGLLDLLLRKTHAISSSLDVRPQLGIRTAWIRQKYNVGYLEGNLFPDSEVHMRTKNKFWGLGPNIGLFAQWNLRYGLSLFSNAAFSILYGEFYVHQDEDLIESKEKTLGVHNIYRQSASIGECSLGLLWERCFTGTLKKLQLAFAWDLSLFFSQNQLMHFVERPSSNAFVSNQGDLSATGGEFSLRFDF